MLFHPTLPPNKYPNYSHMQLLVNEERLVSSNQDKVLLTTQRISLSDKEWGRSYQITILLENISSIENLYQSNPLFAVLSGFSLLVGIIILGQGRDSNGTLVFGCFGIAFILLIIWLNSKRQVVTIASMGGAKLNFRVAGMSADQIEGFIDKVLAAQATRVKDLHPS
jgi:hypothetical protein